MFNSYRSVLSYPRAWQFSIAALIVRIPVAMIVISIVLMISGLYNSYSLAGQVSAINIIAYAIALPFLAKLTDRHGQFRIMFPCAIVSGLALWGLVILAMLHAPAWQLFIASAISGASEGNFGAFARARWATVTQRADHLHTAFAWESTLDELTMIIGPILATTLATSVHSTAGLWACGGIWFIGITWFLLQRSTEPQPAPPDDTAPRGTVMRSGAMISMALVYICAGTIFGASELVTVAFCESLGTKATAGLVMAGFAAGSLLGGLLYGMREWKLSLLRRYLAGLAILAAGSSLFLIARTPLQLTAIMFLTGLSCAPTFTNVNTIVHTIIHKSRLTEGLAWMSTFLNVGLAIGSNISGVLIDNFTVHAGFQLIALSAWLMLIITVLMLPILRKSLHRAQRRQIHHVVIQDELAITQEKRDNA